MGAFDDLLPAAPASPYDDLVPRGTAAPPREGHGVWDAAVAGWQGSVPGLVDRGRLPDIVLNPEHAKWYERAIANVSQTVNELPEMLAGTVAGGAAGGAAGGPIGTILGAGAGALAVPAEIRQSLIHAYETGEADSTSTFLQRAGIVIKGLTEPEVLKATAKAAAVGALTGGAGALAARGAGSVLAPLAGDIGVPAVTRGITAAQVAGEVGTLGVAPAVLEGRMPEMRDIADAAVVVGGMKFASGAASKMGQIYARTGVTPEQVVADAHADPTIAAELKDPALEGIPTAYKPAAAAEVARMVVPDPKTDPNHALDLVAMITQPFGEIPASKLPNYENFRFVDGPDDLKAISARASEVFGQQIEAARGKETWNETRDKAIEFLTRRAAERGETFTVPTNDDALVNLARNGMAAESMQQSAVMALEKATERVSIENEVNAGGVSDEASNAQLAAIEMVRSWTALDQGNGAEIARALNARKAMLQMRGIATGVMEAYGKYGNDPVALANAIRALKDPLRVRRFVNQLDPATTMDKFLHYFRFSLLTGATVFQVKAVGDMLATTERYLNAALRVPAAALGSGEIGARAAELGAITGAIGQGIKDGFFGIIETWKAMAQPQAVFGEPGKPNLADRITNVPRRIIESETDFFRVLNERMEMARQATSSAMSENFRPGTQDFAQRVTTLLQTPTRAMTDAATEAGREATFTNKTAGLGKLLQDVSNGKYGKMGGFLIPFARVPVNIAAWSIKDTPALGLLMEGNREDWAAGGAKRDGVIARQVIGGTAALLAASAVGNGTLTGGGQSLSPEQRAARRAAGIQDYSKKFGDTWYSYERFQPLGTIMMLASDLMEMHQQADENAKADIAKMTAAVMGHAIISQPYFEGIHSFMEAMTSPEKGGRMFDSFVGAWIPSILAQSAATIDPEKRRVDSLFDAVQQRIPFWREQLLPQINPLTGEAEPRPRGLGLISTVTQTDDKVLSEAARLQIGITKAPKNLQLPSGADKAIGKVELTPEQQNMFTSESGKLAHEILTTVVGDPTWQDTPYAIKQQIFREALKQGRQIGAAKALPGEPRAAAAQAIADGLMAELGPGGRR